MSRPKLRHIALSVEDPFKTAEFYKEAFGMEEVGQTNSPLARGVYLSDGTMNMALLNFKHDEWAGADGKAYRGIHHMGFWGRQRRGVGEEHQRGGRQPLQRQTEAERRRPQQYVVRREVPRPERRHGRHHASRMARRQKGVTACASASSSAGLPALARSRSGAWVTSASTSPTWSRRSSSGATGSASRSRDPLDVGGRIRDEEVRRGLPSTVINFMRHHTDHHSLVLFPREAMNVLFGRPDWTGRSINQSSWQVGTLREVRNGIDWFEKIGVELSRFGRDVPGSNWHTYPYDPEGHTNEIFCGMEQIGWQSLSKPRELFSQRHYRDKPELPYISERREIEDGLARGVDLGGGYRPEPAKTDERYDVGGLWLPRPFKITNLGPERLFVQDVEAALEFYQDVLGLTLTEEIDYHGHRIVFLRVNTEHHSLALYPIELRDELELSPNTTLMSIGVQLAEYSQLKAAIPYLEARGITIRYLPPELYPGIDYAAFAIDPDGHAVQLYFQMEQIGWGRAAAAEGVAPRRRQRGVARRVGDGTRHLRRPDVSGPFRVTRTRASSPSGSRGSLDSCRRFQ